jgi:glycosyltransferase involved in cell wall biosynthesis
MIVQNDFVNDSRIIKEANALGQNGFEVNVLALHNDGLKEVEEFEFFLVKRIKLATRSKLGKNKFSQVFKFWEFKQKCLKEALKFNPDFVHCHDVYTLPIGEKIIAKLGQEKIKLIYDSHELWSQASNNLTMPKPLLYVQNSIEKKIIKKCDSIITVSPSIVKYLKKVYNLCESPILIRNIPFLYKNVEKEKLFHKQFKLDDTKRILIYQGVISKGRGIEKLIEAMKFVDEKIVFVVLGNGSMVENYKNLVKELNLQNRVYFHPAVSPDVLVKYTASADLGVSLIKNICLSYYYSLPNKMFEYIQAEIPVLCSNYPDMEEIVTEYRVGEVTNPDDSNNIADAINKILSDNKMYKEYADSCISAKKELNWQCESKKLIKLYQSL